MLPQPAPERRQNRVGQTLHPFRRPRDPNLIPKRMAEHAQHQQGRHSPRIELAIPRQSEERLEEILCPQCRPELLPVVRLGIPLYPEVVRHTRRNDHALPSSNDALHSGDAEAQPAAISDLSRARKPVISTGGQLTPRQTPVRVIDQPEVSSRDLQLLPRPSSLPISGARHRGHRARHLVLR